MRLLLRAVDVAGPLQWRWLLTDEETGERLADHLVVDLDPASDEVARFADLYEYQWWRAAPDRRPRDGAKIVADAGGWAGHKLLGETVVRAIVTAAAAGPVTVRVTAAPPAGQVLSWPLELAHADGGPLAARGDVTFVYDIAGTTGAGAIGQEAGGAGGPRVSGPGSAGPGVRKPEAGHPLRILAVFSQPTATDVLALRRERHALSELVGGIVARERAAVELRAIQYGVTREVLAAEIAGDGEGWDILHMSGHGIDGTFLLEKPDGSPDAIAAADLVTLLRPVRSRVRLAVICACEYAASVTAQAYRLPGLTAQAEALEAESVSTRPATGRPDGAAASEPAGRPGARPGTQIPVLARALVHELGCAVIAMRYPVTDRFAIRFGRVLYEQLLSCGQPVDVAVAQAVATAGSARHRAISLATPGVFGASAAGLRFAVPRGRPVMDPAEQKMAYFPKEPDRFVGRAGEMAKASAALAPGSGKTAVVLHGMVGAGKTACALELAYRREDSFAALAFWRAPDRDDEWPSAFPNFANRLDMQLARYGVTMASHIGTEDSLRAFLPFLRSIMASNRFLLVLDNLETLLTPGGAWRDPRWALLISGLTSHDGESRVILTSCIPPAALVAGQPSGRVVTLPVRSLDPGQFPDELTPWTVTTLGVLSPEARLMAQFVACLEDDDRASDVVGATWPGLWRQLGRPARANGQEPPAGQQAALAASAAPVADDPADVPEPGPLLAALTASALIEAEPVAAPRAGGGAAPGDGPGAGGDAGAPGPVVFWIHPGVAAAITAQAGPEIREAADAELAAFWQAIAAGAREGEDGEDSRLIVRAGLAAAPYLLRRGDRDIAGALLEHAVVRDDSPGLMEAVRPWLREIAAATGTSLDLGRLGRVLSRAYPGEAELMLRRAMADAAASENYVAAAAAAGSLVDLLLDGGRLEDALDAAGWVTEYVERGNCGPLTRLAGQAHRLRVLERTERPDRVLAEVDRLCVDMAEAVGQYADGELIAQYADNEFVHPWDILESIFDTGRSAALAMGNRQRSLDLNAGVADCQRQRGADMREVTTSQFRDVGPLIELGRLEEAGQLLAQCQPVFDDHNARDMLARLFGARAKLEAALGHGQAAAGQGRTALRMFYDHCTPEDIAMGHHDLAVFLGTLGDDRAGQRAHWLAGALIFRLTDMAYYLKETVRGLADELRKDGDAEGLPSTVAQVVAVAEQTEGVRLGALLNDLPPGPQALDEALAEILREATELAEAQDPGGDDPGGQGRSSG